MLTLGSIPIFPTATIAITIPCLGYLGRPPGVWGNSLEMGRTRSAALVFAEHQRRTETANAQGPIAWLGSPAPRILCVVRKIGNGYEKICRSYLVPMIMVYEALSGFYGKSIFLSGLLSTGQLQIAEGLLQSKKSALSLDDRTVEDICLTSSRKFYDNASSGNYTFGDMKLAYDCLSIPSRSEKVIREQEFIEATSRITSFNVESRPGVPLTPIEIRLTKDRLSLVSRVLSGNSDAYKYEEGDILELVDKLGFRGDVVARVKALAMIADTALQAEDFMHAFETSEATIDTVSQLCLLPGISEAQLGDAKEVCWVFCFQVRRQEHITSTRKARQHRI